MPERLEAALRDVDRRGQPALGHRLGPGTLRGHGRGLAGDCRGRSAWSARRPGPAASTRRAPRFPLRHLPVRPGARLDLANRRRLRPCLRALAGDPAVRRRSSGSSSSRCPTAPIRMAVGSLQPDAPGRLAGRGLARRDLPRGPDRRRRADSPATRSSTRRSTTGSAWRWRCGTSRSPTSRCATRASTCRTADTTCKETGHAASLARPPEQGHRTIAYPAQLPALPDRFRGLPVVDRRKCPDGCRACAEACPTDAIAIDGRRACGWTWAAACSAPTASRPVRRGPSATRQDYRLATRTREDLILRRPDARSWPRPWSEEPPAVRPVAQAARRSAPAAATPARPT